MEMSKVGREEVVECAYISTSTEGVEPVTLVCLWEVDLLRGGYMQGWKRRNR